MAEFRFGTTLARGDVVVDGLGTVRTVISNQNETVTWALGARDSAQLLQNDREGIFNIQHVHHDALRANMLVLTTL